MRETLDSIRSPSPETIARMGNTGPAMSPSSRTASFEKRSVHRSGSLGGEDSSGSPRSQRSRSPKPETDGRLDRGFKFPVAGGSKQAPRIRTKLSDGDESLSSPVMQTPIVHIQAPSTDGPISAPVGYSPVEEEIKEFASEEKESDTPPLEDVKEDAKEDVAKQDADASVPTAADTVSKEDEAKPSEDALAEVELTEPASGAPAVAETAKSETVATEPAVKALSQDDVSPSSDGLDNSTVPKASTEETAVDKEATTVTSEGAVDEADAKTTTGESNGDDKAEAAAAEGDEGEGKADSNGKDVASDSKEVTSVDDATSDGSAKEAHLSDEAGKKTGAAKESTSEELADVDLK